MQKSYALDTWLNTEARMRLNEKSNLKAVFLFSKYFFIYVFCLFGAIANYSNVANVICSLYLGLVIAQLFIVGHDACHQSLAKSPLLNKAIGRLAFLPAIHSYSIWAVLHNKSHHSYTNIKNLDHAWTPMTKDEYDQKNSARRFLENIYRSYFGAGIYYLIDMWLWRLIVPINRDVRHEWQKHIPDTLFILAFAVIQPLIIIYTGSYIVPSKSIVELLFLGWLIPFLSWNWIMGFVIYVQHTHPKIAWFRADERLPFNQSQTHVTSHVIFPEPINSLLYHVMDHTAHHLQPSVPIYNLHQVQDLLETIHSEDILIYRWTLAEYIRITKICKLYDFENKRWTDFKGNPTSEPVSNL